MLVTASGPTAYPNTTLLGTPCVHCYENGICCRLPHLTDVCQGIALHLNSTCPHTTSGPRSGPAISWTYWIPRFPLPRPLPLNDTTLHDRFQRHTATLDNLRDTLPLSFLLLTTTTQLRNDDTLGSPTGTTTVNTRLGLPCMRCYPSVHRLGDRCCMVAYNKDVCQGLNPILPDCPNSATRFPLQILSRDKRNVPALLTALARRLHPRTGPMPLAHSGPLPPSSNALAYAGRRLALGARRAHSLARAQLQRLPPAARRVKNFALGTAMVGGAVPLAHLLHQYLNPTYLNCTDPPCGPCIGSHCPIGPPIDCSAYDCVNNYLWLCCRGTRTNSMTELRDDGPEPITDLDEITPPATLRDSSYGPHINRPPPYASEPTLTKDAFTRTNSAPQLRPKRSLVEQIWDQLPTVSFPPGASAQEAIPRHCLIQTTDGFEPADCPDVLGKLQHQEDLANFPGFDIRRVCLSGTDDGLEPVDCDEILDSDPEDYPPDPSWIQDADYQWLQEHAKPVVSAFNYYWNMLPTLSFPPGASACATRYPHLEEYQQHKRIGPQFPVEDAYACQKSPDPKFDIACTRLESFLRDRTRRSAPDYNATREMAFLHDVPDDLLNSTGLRCYVRPATCPNNTYLFRSDGKCGDKHPILSPSGHVFPRYHPLHIASECNPWSLAPCCSRYGWCGNSEAHCKGGQDFSADNLPPARTVTWKAVSVPTGWPDTFQVTHPRSRVRRQTPTPPTANVIQKARRITRLLKHHCYPAYPVVYEHWLPTLPYLCNIDNPGVTRPLPFPQDPPPLPRHKREAHILASNDHMRPLLTALNVTDLPEIYYAQLEVGLSSPNLTISNLILHDAERRLSALLAATNTSSRTSHHSNDAHLLLQRLASFNAFSTLCDNQPNRTTVLPTLCQLKTVLLTDYLSAALTPHVLTILGNNNSQAQLALRTKRQVNYAPPPPPPPPPRRFDDRNGRPGAWPRHRGGPPLQLCEDIARHDGYDAPLLNLAIHRCAHGPQPLETVVLAYLANQANLLALMDQQRELWVEHPYVQRDRRSADPTPWTPQPFTPWTADAIVANITHFVASLEPRGIFAASIAAILSIVSAITAAITSAAAAAITTIAAKTALLVTAIKAAIAASSIGIAASAAAATVKAALATKIAAITAATSGITATAIGTGAATAALNFIPAAGTFIWVTAAQALVVIGSAEAYYAAKANGAINDQDVIGTNIGAECLSHCDNLPGYCTFCGPEGLCCMIGDVQRGCNGYLGINDTYTCTLPVTDRLTEARQIILDESIFIADDVNNIAEHRNFLSILVNRELHLSNITATSLLTPIITNSPPLNATSRSAPLNDTILDSNYAEYQLTIDDFASTLAEAFAAASFPDLLPAVEATSPLAVLHQLPLARHLARHCLFGPIFLCDTTQRLLARYTRETHDFDLTAPVKPIFLPFSNPHVLHTKTGDAAVDVQYHPFSMSITTTPVDRSIYALIQQVQHRIASSFTEPLPKPQIWRRDNPDIPSKLVPYLVRRDNVLHLAHTWNNLKATATRNLEEVQAIQLSRPALNSTRDRRSAPDDPYSSLQEFLLQAATTLTVDQWILLHDHRIRETPSGFQYLVFDAADQTIALPVGNLRTALDHHARRMRRDGRYPRDPSRAVVYFSVLWDFLFSFLSKKQATKAHQIAYQLTDSSTPPKPHSPSPNGIISFLKHELSYLTAAFLRTVQEAWDADALWEDHFSHTKDTVLKIVQLVASTAKGALHYAHLFEVPWPDVTATYAQERTKGYLPLAKTPFDHLTVQTSLAAIRRGGRFLGFNVILHAPLVHQHGHMSAFASIPTPIEVTPGSFITFHPSQERIILVQHEQDPGTAGHKWVALSSAEFAACRPAGNFHTCRNIGVLRPPIPDRIWPHHDSSICAYALYSRKPHLMASACQRTEATEDFSATRLGPFSWAIFSRYEVQPTIQCPTGHQYNPTVPTPVLGTGILRLPAGCKASIKGWTLLSDRDNLANVEQMVFPFKVRHLDQAIRQTMDAQQQALQTYSRDQPAFDDNSAAWNVALQAATAQHLRQDASAWTTPMTIALLVIIVLTVAAIAILSRYHTFRFRGHEYTLSTFFSGDASHPSRMNLLYTNLDKRLYYLERQTFFHTRALNRANIETDHATPPALPSRPSIPFHPRRHSLGSNTYHFAPPPSNSIEMHDT